MITFEANFLSRIYVNEISLPWPLVVDENRALYRHYGMLSASLWNIWGPKTWFVYLKEIMKGQKLKKSEGDIMQRGGDVLIDPNGIVRMHHVGEGPADRPSFETIFKRVTG